MTVEVFPYPRIGDNLVEAMGLRVDLRFSTGSSGVDLGVRQAEDGTWCCAADSNWDPDQHDLNVTCDLGPALKIESLFGPTGVSCADGELGLALEWTSVESAVRGVGAPLRLDRRACLDAGGGSLTLPSLCFESRALRGMLRVWPAVFVVRPGVATRDQWHLGNSPGLALGALAPEVAFRVDGGGGLFPVRMTSEVGEPLWWLHTAGWEGADLGDLLLDPDHVALVLNKAHRDYDQLEGEGRLSFHTPVARQVLSSWIALFLSRAETYLGGPGSWEELKEECLPGSIGQAACTLRDAADVTGLESDELFAATQVWVDKRLRR